MKKNLLITLAVCLASAAAVMAQPFSTIRLTISQPVIIGNTTLPAGAFSITDMNNNGSSSLVIIRSDAGPSASMMMSRTIEAPSVHADKANVLLKQTNGGYEIESFQMNGQQYTAPTR